MTTPEESPEENTNGPKRVLIVDDEKELAELLSTHLNTIGDYEAEHANSVEEAIEKLKVADYRLVISDIRMPGLSGVDLLKWIKEHKPKIRDVMMTGFAEMKDTLDASELGVRAFMMKPFSMEKFTTVVNEALMQVSWAEFDESKYAGMTIGEFISPAELKYPVYIRLKDSRFMKIGETGDNVPRDKLLGLREKGINELWLELPHFKDYKDSQIKVAKAVSKRKDLPAENRIKMLKAAGELASEQLRVMGTNE